MVIRDQTRKAIEGEQPRAQGVDFNNLANPSDRLGALIIDLSVVLIPIFLLVSSPFRHLLMRSILLENEIEFAVSAVAIILMGVILLIGYMTIMLSVGGSTFGKMVFGLRVVNIWSGRRLSVGEAFSRSVLWVSSLFLGMIPYISVLSDSKRRPWHDRFANSIVLSVASKKSASPNAYERIFVQSILGSLVALTIVAMMFAIPKVWQSLLHFKLLPFANQFSQSVCDEVDWALSFWPRGEKEQQEARLNVALTLFAAGEVGKECLENEATTYLDEHWSENPTAYLAQAFVHSENPEVSNQYLERVCEIAPESSSCRMSRIVEDWSDSNWEKVETHFSSFVSHTPLHVAVWAVRHFVKRREYLKAESFLDQISMQSSLAGFLSRQRIKIFQGTRRSHELDVAAMTAIETLSAKDRLRVTENMCERHLSRSMCGESESRYCDLIADEVAADADLLLSPRTAILFARSSICKTGSLSIEDLLDQLPMEETREYAKVVQLMVRGSRKSALDALRSLKNLGDITNTLKERLDLDEISLTDSREQYSRRLILWRQEQPTHRWGLRGAELLKQAIRLKDFRSAELVGRLLLAERFAEEQVAKGFLYSLVKLDRIQQAEREFQRYFGHQRLERANSTNRGPASVDEKVDSISTRFFRQLENEFAYSEEQ